MILIKLKDVLDRKNRTLYWLASATGVPYVTLWKMVKKETQDSVNLPILSRVCTALECAPGDLLVLTADDEDKAVAALVKARDSKKSAKASRKGKL